jgi:hypothetical protein
MLWRDGGYDDLFGPAITTPYGKILLVVSDVKAGIPEEVQIRVRRSSGMLSIIGGVDVPEQRAMVEFFLSACGPHLLPGLTLLGAGNRLVQVPAGVDIATAEENELHVDPTIMEIPGLLGRLNPSCFTLGVVPRVSTTMWRYGRYTLVTRDSKSGRANLINPAYHMVWVVQRKGSVLGWDGDIALKSALMDTVRRPQPGTDTGRPVGVMAWNGGPVTAREIMQALLDGVPLLVMEGSGRFCDDLINWRNGNTKRVSAQGATILQTWLGNPGLNLDFSVAKTVAGARAWLAKHGLLAA